MLALTMGDPAGIGGELTTEIWRRGSPAPFVVLDDPDRLRSIATVPVEEVTSVAQAREIFGRALPVLRVDLRVPSRPGFPDPLNAPSVIESITRAVQLTQSGEASGVVTNPISKEVLYRAGFQHPGHTEFLAALTDSRKPVMMLVAPGLRVVPVTVHVPLRSALESLCIEQIVDTAAITHQALVEQWGIERPRLAVAGVNPHAGEAGTLGREEIEIVVPAVEALRMKGIDAVGPMPPDTMFTSDARGRYDVAICMYHDQALIPLKTLDHAHGVNVTLGISIIRTSPDHGTAFDIAGQGISNPSSLDAALRLAHELGLRRFRRGDDFAPRLG